MKALHELECLLPRRGNATIGNSKREKLDRVALTRLRFIFQTQFDGLFRSQQGYHGIQPEFLPRPNFDIQPIPSSGSGENAEAARPRSIDPVDWQAQSGSLPLECQSIYLFATLLENELTL
jgi:hypothetical protein